jgi:hypothetical protein
VNTFESAAGLSVSKITRSWEVLATIGTLCVIILSAVLLGHVLDRREAARETTAQSAIGKKNAASLTAFQPRWTFKRSSTGDQLAKIQPVIVGDVRTATSKRNARAELKAMLASKSKSDIALIEESIPRILSSQQSIGEKVSVEMKRHHRWFGIYFFYSSCFPRALRVISLATNIIIMLFIQSITYNLTNPDDGSCKLYDAESTCLKETSAYMTGEPKCAWTWNDATKSTGGKCTFIEPDSSIKIVLFVAVFSAVLSTPIALSIDWVVQHILAAPLDTSLQQEGKTATSLTSGTTSASSSGDAPSSSFVEEGNSAKSNGTSSASITLLRPEDESSQQGRWTLMKNSLRANADMVALQTAIYDHRLTLTNHDDLSEFDSKFRMCVCAECVLCECCWWWWWCCMMHLRQ